MTFRALRQQIVNRLKNSFSDSEARILSESLLLHFTGFSKVEFFLKENESVLDEIQHSANLAVERLLNHEPLQYIIEKAEFFCREFYVNSNVLIPRPETEELIQLINETCGKNGVGSFLDIGTGSGCIPITLKILFSQAKAEAVDISEGALEVARHNASAHLTDILFHKIDILDENQLKLLGRFDLIVSNPPYIHQSEASLMKKNVLDFEPHLALFVENADVLIFYRKIAQFARVHLNENGWLFFECNEFNAHVVGDILQEIGYYNVEVVKDINSKDRMLKAQFKLV